MNDMEKRNDRLVAFCIAISSFLSFLVGLAAGIHYMKSECDHWSVMYNDHINRQWEMIQERDSIYMHHLDIRLHCDKYDSTGLFNIK